AALVREHLGVSAGGRRAARGRPRGGGGHPGRRGERHWCGHRDRDRGRRVTDAPAPYASGPEPTERDFEELRLQLGRPARGVVEIAARCVCGRPLVVKTEPRLPDGSPFPTTFYLTHPAPV